MTLLIIIITIIINYNYYISWIGCNLYCLDKNYGGVLIIWDKLFGTFMREKEKEEIIYGLVVSVQSFNPLYLQVRSYLFRPYLFIQPLMKRTIILLHKLTISYVNIRSIDMISELIYILMNCSNPYFNSFIYRLICISNIFNITDMKITNEIIHAYM